MPLPRWRHFAILPPSFSFKAQKRRLFEPPPHVLEADAFLELGVRIESPADAVVVRSGETITTVCGFCSTGCGLEIHLKNGEAVGLSPARDYSVTWEWNEFAYVCDYRVPSVQPQRVGIIDAFHGDERRRHGLDRQPARRLHRFSERDVDGHVAQVDGRVDQPEQAEERQRLLFENRRLKDARGAGGVRY